MPATVYTSAVITINAALNGYAPSNTVFNTEVATAALGINAYANSMVPSSMSNADLSALVMTNMGLSPNADLQQALTDYLASVPNDRGVVILQLGGLLASATNLPAYAAAANAWNAASAQAYAYSSAGITSAVPVPFLASGVTFTQTLSSAAGADVMHLTGDQDVRIDFTDMLKQIRGLDLNGNGTIANDGKENNSPLGANSALTNHPTDNKFEIVDAYRRDAFNDFNKASNFLGDIAFDGTGFGGDGVATNGNIFLGGLGADTASGGDGNDFLAGGGIAQGHGGTDTMYGMRNADFFFAEFSGLDATDGSSLRIDGGISSDEQSAGVDQSAEDSDWLLFEASDDDEPVQIWLNNDNATSIDDRDSTTVVPIGVTGATPTGDGLHDDMGRVLSRTGESMLLDDVENVDASGNLYGFLKNLNVQLGGRGGDDRDPAFVAGSANNGQGSSAQLAISGSNVANIIIGGFDNDYIEGRGGDDLLMGGNVKSYITNGTTIAQQLLNPNLLTIPNDGRDELRGGADNDNIVFEADLGIIDGGTETDTLWITANSLGTSSTGVLSAANTLRFDLKASTLANSAGYGGADVADTQDQTNYGGAAGTGRVTVTGMESVIATGLGSIDFLASGANNPELNIVIDNQQNFQRYTGNLDLRGDDAVNTLYASDGVDVLEGRMGGTVTTNASGAITSTGDNRDKLSGGAASDKFIFALGVSSGDGVDVIHRQVDANNDNIWDGTFGKDFGEKGAVVTQNSKLTLTLTDSAHPVDLSGFPVNGVAFQLDGVAYTVSLTSGVKGTYAAFNTGLNAALDANPALAALESVLNADNTMTITDPAGKTFVAVGYTFIDNVVPPAGTLTWNQTVGAPDTSQDKDVLIYAAYEDRADGELVDDNAVTGSAISLGLDSYAEDLVADFRNGSTWLAEDQRYTLTFTNLTTEDKVEININNVVYKLTVGVDLDGNEIAGEELVTQGGTAASLAAIQTAFLTRMAGFITSFMDDDTAAGKVTATSLTGSTIELMQAAYSDSEETVFMRTPTVTLSNDSGGEPAKVSVLNNSQHEVQLLDFDGRNGELNATNVLFIGNQGEANSRSIFATGAGATGAANTMTGSEAMVIDGGTNTLQATLFGATTVIADNTATNSFLRTDFTVHGDDQLIGGAANDTITAGTGDDRVLGSLGTDSADGGKSYYAVQVLGETQARVYVMNQWEANNPTLVAAMTAITTAGGVISSINRIGDAETGNATPVSTGKTEVYNDTLEFQQRDFSANTKFTVVLDTFTGNTAATVAFPFAGAGHVMVDDAGDGTTDGTTTFTNFENIRTVSGTGNAVANDNQGNDTLNVSALSTATSGISYDLTNRTAAAPTSTAGDVRYSTNADTADGGGDAAGALFPDENDFESLVIKVDGVESVIAGTGNDLLMIDETEAAKHNSFDANLGLDRIEYLNDYNTAATIDLDGDADVDAADQLIAEDYSEPTVTIKLDNIAAVTTAATGTDTVTMTSGRVGLTVAVDSLTAVERIALAGNTAEGRAEADLLDVTAMTTGAIVDYTNGQVRDLTGTVHVTIEGLADIENVWADGNDTVMVASAASMSGGNARSDAATGAGTDNSDITLATFVDFDQLVSATNNTRVAFLSQSSTQIEDAINQRQYTFNLSKTGSGVDTDTVDYSNAVDNIAVVVELDATKPNQYVLTDSDGAAFYDAVGDLEEANDRTDVLVGVERIVAAQGESVLDLTASTKGLEVKFNSAAVADRIAGNATTNAYDVTTVRISDLTTSSPLSRSYVEYRDSTDAALVDVVGATNKATATWDRVEGSDNAEKVILNSAHSVDTNAFNLRGGANEVKYNELTKSITFSLSVSDFVASNALNTGKITGTVTFQDGTGAGVESTTFLGGVHTITSYTANNAIDPKNLDADLTNNSSLRIAASQDAEDNLKLSGLDSKIFLVSEIGTVDNQITLKIGSGAAQNSVVLTGFELVTDSESNDVYDFGSLVNAVAGLNFIDNATKDHDTIKVGNDVVTALGTPTAISLAGLNVLAALAPAGFDFDVLDVTKVTDTAVTTLTGVAAGEGTDEVVIGNFQGITTVQNFESVVLTQDAVTQNGTTYSLDTTGNKLVAGAKTLTFNNDMNTLSFGGTALEGTYGSNTALNATGNVTVTIVGNEAVTLIGGNGNDALTSKGGNDTLIGGAGNDTLDGGRVAAVGEVATMTLSGGAGVLGAADELTITGNVATLTVSGSGAPASDLNLATATGDADQVGALLVAQTTTFLETQLGYAAGSIASVAYDAGSNVFTINFTVAAGNVTDLTAADGAGTLDPVAAVTPGTAAVESQDTYVFEATAALNGVDAINNFNGAAAATDDILNFSAFLGVQGAAAANDVDLATGDITVASGGVAVGFGKGTLASADVVTVGTAANGEIVLADNGKAVVLVSADTDGDADLVSTQGYDVYYIQDTNSSVTAQTWVVTKVATINGATELDGDTVLVEGLVLGSNAANTITVATASTILGGGGNDIITGSISNDRITGGMGADTIAVGVDAAADVVVFTAVNEGADTVTGFVAANDAIEIDGALQAQLDDITVNAAFAFLAAAGGAGAATAANITTTDEAIIISAAENATITAAQLTDLALVAAKLGLEITMTSATGDDALIVLESTTAGTYGVYVYQENGTAPNAVSAAELTLLGVVTADAVTTADFTMV